MEKQETAVSADGLTWPAQMTTITIQDEKDNRLTEGNSGVGDLAWVMLSAGSVRLFANWGNPSLPTGSEQPPFGSGFKPLGINQQGGADFQQPPLKQ